MELTKSNIKKIRGLIVFTTLIILCLWKNEMVLEYISYAFSVIFPFVLGIGVAFIINVPMSFIEVKISKYFKKSKHLLKWSRPIALIFTLMFIVGIMLLVSLVVIPQLIVTITNLGVSIKNFIPELASFAGDLFENNPEIEVMINSFTYDWEQIIQIGLNMLQLGAGNIFDTTLNVAMSVVSAATTFIIGFIFAIYIVLQKEVLGLQFRKVIFAFVRKGRGEAVLEVLELAYHTFSSFLTGQCLEAVILGSIIFVVLLIFNIPFAVLIGVLVAFTALIPMFGAFLGCTIGSILIFIEDPIKALTFIIIFLIVQQIEGNLIYPYVVGNSVGLPAIWVLVAVSIGGSLMGVVGMLIFIPITSVVYALFREIVYIKLKQNNITVEEIIALKKEDVSEED